MTNSKELLEAAKAWCEKNRKKHPREANHIWIDRLNKNSKIFIAGAEFERGLGQAREIN